MDSHFASAADIAADEWSGQRERDRENAEKELLQFVHCIPYVLPDVDLQTLDADAVARRSSGLKKGIIPPDCVGVTVGVDTGRKLLHWVAIAWLPTGGGRVVEYGTQQTDADRIGTREGLIAALRTLRGYFASGWLDETGERHTPAQVWIDSGYHEHTDAVYTFCIEAAKDRRRGGETYRPSKGYGDGQRGERYWAPKKTDWEVRYIGNNYHLAWLPRAAAMLCHVNSDVWKSQLHQRLSLPTDAPAAIELYAAADPIEHRLFGEHLTAEKQVTKWSETGGETIVWERVRRQNHYLDSSYAAVAAGDLLLAFHRPKTTGIGRPAEVLGGGGLKRKTLAEMAAESGETVGWFEQQRQKRGESGRPWLASNR